MDNNFNDNNQRSDMNNQRYIPPQNPHDNNMEPQKTDRKAVVSFVLGILSVVFLFIPYIPFVFAVIGVPYGIVAKKNNTAGLVLSIIGLVLGVSVLMMVISCVSIGGAIRAVLKRIEESLFWNFHERAKYD